MANYYSDIPELKYHLENPMMKRIVELKERDFRDKDEFDYAPVDYADAMDSYNKVLDIVGDITANVIAPNAEGVDEEGPHCHDGRNGHHEGYGSSHAQRSLDFRRHAQKGADAEELRQHDVVDEDGADDDCKIGKLHNYFLANLLNNTIR